MCSSKKRQRGSHGFHFSNLVEIKSQKALWASKAEIWKPLKGGRLYFKVSKGQVTPLTSNFHESKLASVLPSQAVAIVLRVGMFGE